MAFWVERCWLHTSGCAKTQQARPTHEPHMPRKRHATATSCQKPPQSKGIGQATTSAPFPTFRGWCPRSSQQRHELRRGPLQLQESEDGEVVDLVVLTLPPEALLKRRTQSKMHS